MLMTQHEMITPNKNYPFKLFEFNSEDSSRLILPHWHNSIEILLCLEGVLEIRLSQSTFHLTEGGVYLINSNIIHSTRTPRPGHVFVLQVPLEFVQQCTENNYGKKIYFQDDLSNNNKIQQNLLAVRQLDMRNDLSSHALVFAKVYELFSRLLATEVINGPIIKEAETVKKLGQLSEINTFIKKHYQENLTLEAVATQFNYNASYFSRFYKRFMGISFVEYLNSVRINAAYKLLLETDMRIIDIANASGFGNVKSFYLMFKKQFQLSPQQYRKKQGK
ncbi:AraC family transcriptional regulator [Tetragenococcus halophilus]|nr:AraC family transcriptional regulator [Tetragenococcus halophilus]